MLSVALLGGESSGKTTLASALQHELTARGLSCTVVAEHLRNWCMERGRAPLAHEQAAIADEQTRRIAAARADVVLADTTALVVAAYSELYFNDTGLWPAAIEAQRGMGLTLLMGLDLPWVPDGLMREGPDLREATDSVLRQRLVEAGIAFQTVTGVGDARVRQALRAIGTALGRPLLPADDALTEGSGRWTCESCSDPDCEHRLFSALLAGRSPRPG